MVQSDLARSEDQDWDEARDEECPGLTAQPGVCAVWHAYARSCNLQGSTQLPSGAEPHNEIRQRLGCQESE